MNTQQKDIRDNIINLFDIDKLPPEKQEDAINRIGQIIFQSVLMKTLPLLKEEDVNEYEKLLERDVAPDVLMDFLGEKVPNFLEIVAQESENFRREAGEVFSNIK